MAAVFVKGVKLVYGGKTDLCYAFICVEVKHKYTTK